MGFWPFCQERKEIQDPGHQRLSHPHLHREHHPEPSSEVTVQEAGGWDYVRGGGAGFLPPRKMFKSSPVLS